MPRGARLAVVLAVVAGGCAGDNGAASPGPASPSPSMQGSPAASAPAPSPSAPGSSPSAAASGEFTNPVLEANFADPFVLEVDGTYYGYATSNLTWNIQVSTSPDLVEWTSSREALPRLPLWQPRSKGLTWAPEVIQTDAGFVMHYTTRDVQAGKQCLAVAVADDPAGPFVDESEKPLVCQVELGGSIDSTPFRDEDGSLWLAWKNDGNCCGIRTRMFIAPLDESGTALTGDPVDLGLENDRPWERNVIEAPTIWLEDGTYYLFYSANDYGSKNYAVGYATADSLQGPYVDAEENPILVSAGDAAGPGHQSLIVDDDGELWIAYHAWDAALIGDSMGGRRALWIDRLVFEDGKPVVQGPTGEPQPVP